jgi:hypothetical protein
MMFGTIWSSGPPCSTHLEALDGDAAFGGNFGGGGVQRQKSADFSAYGTVFFADLFAALLPGSWLARKSGAAIHPGPDCHFSTV